MKASKLTYRTILGVIVLPFFFNLIRYHTFLSSPLCISITSVLLTIALLLTLQKGLRAQDVILIWILIGTLAITAVLFDSLGTVFTCYNIFIVSLLLNHIQFSKQEIKNIHLLSVVVLGIFIASLKITPNYETYRVFLWHGEEININSLGVLILAFYYHFLLLLNSTLKKETRYALFFIITPLAIYLIELTDSRSVYLAVIVFLVLYLNKNFKMEKYPKALMAVIIVAIIFPLAYLMVADELAGLDLGGKSLLTRKYVWESALSYIKQYPIFGSGTVHQMKMNGLGTKLTSSAHNVFLGLWKTVGLVPMLLFAFRLNKGPNMQFISKQNVIRKKMFLSCIFLCIFETLLNDSDTYLFFMLLLLTERDEQSDVAGKTETIYERIHQK